MFLAGFSVASGGIAARVAAWRSEFIILSALTLALSYWQVFVRRRGRPHNRKILVVATILSIFFWLSPWLKMTLGR